jgi:SAM-dependent methyltransferase
LNGGAVERLAFRNPEAHYHAYDAATHVARYLAARPFCTGKRVLDIACGEGYGSFLLAKWGATSVLGIDISEAAIDAANAVFAHECVRFATGSDTALDELVVGYGPFDLILCLETIEHVADPAALLRRLHLQLAPSGVLLISCPNEPNVGVAEAENPYHLSHWTFSDFRSFTEAVLGPATQWLLEAPALGVTLFDALGPATSASDGNPRDMVRGSEPGDTLMMPAQHNVVPGPDDCIAYLGIWGAIRGDAVACAAVSLSGFLQPWSEAASRDKEIATSKDHIATLTQTVATLRESNAELAEVKDRLLREQQEDRQQLLRYSALLASNHDDIATLTQTVAILGDRNAELAETKDRLLREQQEDRERLLHYSALRVSEPVRGKYLVGIEGSRAFQLTRSRRIARLYIRLFTPPDAGGELLGVRRAIRRLLRHDQH